MDGEELEEKGEKWRLWEERRRFGMMRTIFFDDDLRPAEGASQVLQVLVYVLQVQVEYTQLVPVTWKVRLCDPAACKSSSLSVVTTR